MDLRVQRTKRNIINAFLELRMKKPLEKISIKELAELAFINKATFYTHYQDIYDLEEQLEDELIESIMNSLPNPEYFVTKPKQGFRDLAFAMISQAGMTNILFAPPRNVVLLSKLETVLQERIYAIFPDFQTDLEKRLLLTVLIHGCFAATMPHKYENLDEIIEILGNFNECLIREVYAKDKLQ